jgi:exopolyphosphatase/guanosine-5'-triphosphate,3'-diphosphate pyrophosphatase
MVQSHNERARGPKRHGIIEIGTRGIRLLIADASPAGIERIVYSAGELSHLGKELDASGRIPPETTQRIKRIVSRYLEIAQQNQADDLFAIATESVRQSPNRADFASEINQIVPLEVLDKNNEAAFSFLASVEAFESELAPGATVLIVDQGGGSTELIYGSLQDDGLPAVKAAFSLDFGTLALSRLFVTSASATQAWARITGQLRLALEEGDYEARFGDLMQRPPDLAIALGSAITFYMRDEIASVEGRKPPLRGLHGRRVDPDGIVRYLGRIQPTLDEMGLTPGDFAPESDEAIVLSGLVIYAAMAQKHALGQYRISRSGMRYGALSWRAGKRVLVELPANNG